jgi:glucuronate isomerase
MKNFMDENFLLSSETAQQLFHQYAQECPIIDYHCHVNPQEIYEDLKYENITQMWLTGDHYKWRLMRANGIAETYITGTATDYEKFEQWAKTLEQAIGNPLYHWSHLELKRYFGFTATLTSQNTQQVWEHCSRVIAAKKLSVRSIIKQSRVKLLCTTDDPIDSLEWHQKLATDQTFEPIVLPAWRPDGILEIQKEDFTTYLQKLATVTETKITTYSKLLLAIQKRMDYFATFGCTISDHGLNYIMYEPCSTTEVDTLIQKRLAGHQLSEKEVAQYQTMIMLALGKEYSRRNWVMQLHYNCQRNNNNKQLQTLGINTGFDCINNDAPISQLTAYLDALCIEEHLPRTILYSLNPNDDALIDTVIGCYQDASCSLGKMQHGSAWWFNDNYVGMKEQMISLANRGMLANFIGMLTDSRSFLSYTRHEYFRRILCEIIGSWVEQGEFPYDLNILAPIITGISYNNAIEYFNFGLDRI